MSKLRDLASRGDFTLGPLQVSPSRRLVEGPSGKLHLEPLVMQMFLLLVDSGGKVVTRDELFDRVWGGVIVGDDSLNRAIGKVRRAFETAAPGLVDIETIPRTGYRLVGPGLVHPVPAESTAPARHDWFSRRTLLLSGAAAAAAAATGGAFLWSRRSDESAKFDALMDSAVADLDYGDPARNPEAKLAQAVALRPDDARARGTLALASVMYSDSMFGNLAATDPQSAQHMVTTALDIDSAQVEARLAQLNLQRSILDMETTEDRLRQLLEAQPSNLQVMRDLWDLLQCAGRSRDALALVERAIALKPLAASANYPRAQLLWIVGRTSEADRVIDNALEYWPDHRFVRFARFTIFAYTDRARSALAMLDDPSSRPQNYSDQSVALWRKILPIFDDPSPARVQGLKAILLDVTDRQRSLVPQSVMSMATLGDTDAAFAIANKLLAFRKTGESTAGTGADGANKSTAWRFTPWLFTPPCAPLRADPRFAQLCDGIGLTAYWTNRNVKPDFLGPGAARTA